MRTFSNELFGLSCDLLCILDGHLPKRDSYLCNQIIIRAEIFQTNPECPWIMMKHIKNMLWFSFVFFPSRKRSLTPLQIMWLYVKPSDWSFQTTADWNDKTGRDLLERNREDPDWGGLEVIRKIVDGRRRLRVAVCNENMLGGLEMIPEGKVERLLHDCKLLLTVM